MGFIGNVLIGGTFALHKLAHTAAAQNNTPPAHCDLAIQQAASGDGYFNSTATNKIDIPLPGEDGGPVPWYLTQTLRDVPSKSGDTRGTQALALFVNVPESFVGTQAANRTKVCTYLMAGMNETTTSDGSCAGLLSDECLEAIESSPQMKDDDEDCPRVDVRDACGQGFYLSTSKPFNFSTSTCSVPVLPETNLADNYRTFTGIGTYTLTLDNEPDNESYEKYDLRVRQPIPVLVKTRSGTSGSTAQQGSQVLCLAPSQVEEGSREPEGDFPPSSASGLHSGRAAMLAVAVAFVVAGVVL